VNLASFSALGVVSFMMAAAGTHVAAFADSLVHPRWLLVLPNGDVLVAETTAPERPRHARGLRDAIMGRVDGRKRCASVGSHSNGAENVMAVEAEHGHLGAGPFDR
jgi:glucose/arabinose dehydrogenase